MYTALSAFEKVDASCHHLTRASAVAYNDNTTVLGCIITSSYTVNTWVTIYVKVGSTLREANWSLVPVTAIASTSGHVSD